MEERFEDAPILVDRHLRRARSNLTLGNGVDADRLQGVAGLSTQALAPTKAYILPGTEAPQKPAGPTDVVYRA